MLRVKGADTLCPVGPGLVEGWDFHGKQIRTLVNGHVRQDGNTNEMMWDMHYLVADIARTITLQPGDILLSEHRDPRTVYPGDVVEVEVEGLGTLPQSHRRRANAHPYRCRCTTHRIRRGAVHRERRRLGVSRRTQAPSHRNALIGQRMEHS